jgi:ADP-L-glycero-D-manno-heptose 6-epimerase
MVLVTGALGFIGSALIWELNQRGEDNIIACDLMPLSERPQVLRKRKFQDYVTKAELTDYLARLVEGTKQKSPPISWIFHMGANSSTTETDWNLLKEVNLQHSIELFQWARDNQANFIYASSAATYGNGELGFSDELNSDDLRPLNLYGESKVQFDRWVRKQESTPQHWYGLKFFNVYGPSEVNKGSMASVVQKAYHQIKETGQLRLFKSENPDYQDGEQKRDFVYVKDLTRWMLELTERRPKSDIYNMGYGKARSWNDLAKSVFSAMRKPVNIEYIPLPSNLKEQYQYFTQAEMGKWLRAGMSPALWPIEKGVADYVANSLGLEDPYL